MGKNKINRSTRKKKRKEKRHERNLSDSYEKKKGNKRKLAGRIPGSSIEVSLSVSTGMIENLFS